MWMHTFLADIISVINNRLFLEVYSNNLETTTARKKAPKMVKFELNLNFPCLPFTIICGINHP